MEKREVTSSNISAVGYDAGHIHVWFKSGGQHRYPGSQSKFEALAGAESVGKHFHAHIRGKGGERVDG